MNEVKYLAELAGNLKLSSNGDWWHDGRPFENRKLIDLFNRSIVWDGEKNRFLLQIGGNQATFEYEDTAYFVVSLLDQCVPWQILLSDQSHEVLDAGSLKLGQQNQIYCTVKGHHSARFSRSAHQHLLEHALDDASIVVNGHKVLLVSERSQ